MRALIVIALVALNVPKVNAQQPHIVSVTGPRSFPHHRPRFSPPVFFADSFYSDAAYNTGYALASQPSIIMLQAPPANSVPQPQAAPAQPLMIELQGDRYVRVSGEEHSGSDIVDPQAIAPHRTTTPLTPSSRRATQETRLLLVFRDGHHEEVSDYIIANGILYASANYYSEGSWNKQIDLKSLNLPETTNANQSRSISFHLPTAPNEVVVGP